MGEWYQATFGAESIKVVVGPTSASQRAKTLREKPALIYKMYRDPAVGVLQDELIRLNMGPKARALGAKIDADNTDHGDYGPATEAAVIEFQTAKGIKLNGKAVTKTTWDAMSTATAKPGANIPSIKEAGFLSGWPWWLKWGTGLGLVLGANRALKHKKGA